MSDIIYRPKGKAEEYSLLAINHYVGCKHGCTYCYAKKMAAARGNPEFFAKQTIKRYVIDRLKAQVPKLAGTCERVLLCFTCDPYQPLDDVLHLTRKVIEVLNGHDIPFQVLTKGGMRAVRDFDLYGDYDAFATTLTFLDEEKSREWEPFAALPDDRIKAIMMAKEWGIKTWVSLEPVIDAAESLKIIEQTAEFVDLFKIGKINYRKSDIDWRQFGKKAIELCRKHETTYYIKKDLAEYLDGVPFTSVDTRTIERK